MIVSIARDEFDNHVLEFLHITMKRIHWKKTPVTVLKKSEIDVEHIVTVPTWNIS